MAIKVHGNVYSPYVLRVFAALYEKDLEAELVPVNLFVGEHKKEPFLSLNPFGQIPGFQDGDLTIFESRAITQYIAQAYSEKGTRLTFPEDAKKNAAVFTWSEVEAQKFDSVAFSLAYELVIKPAVGFPTDESILEETEKKLAQVLDVYEARLSKSKYLGGDTFTLADLHHTAVVNYLFESKIKKLFDERPHVSAWAADIVARPAWVKVLELRKQVLGN